MRVYRIEKNKYIKKFPPEGSRFVSGRWHKKGMWVLYTSENMALAKLEALANSDKIPENRSLVTIEIDDRARMVEIDKADLPDTWYAFPWPAELAGIIEDIIESGQFVGALVPSCQSPLEKNVLLFPEHKDFDKYVRIIKASAEDFDPRLK